MKSRLPPSKPTGTTPQSGDTGHVKHLRPKPPPWHQTPRKIPTGQLGTKSCHGTAGPRSGLGVRNGPALPHGGQGDQRQLRGDPSAARPRSAWPCAAPARRRLPVARPARRRRRSPPLGPPEAPRAPGRRRRRGDAAHLLALTWLAAVHVAGPPLRVLGAAMPAARPRPDGAPAAPRLCPPRARVPAPEAPPTT